MSFKKDLLNYATAIYVFPKANDKVSAEEPFDAKTFISSSFLYVVSIYSAAPERWATWAHAACKARYRGSGKDNLGSEDVNVMVAGRPTMRLGCIERMS